jgi:hypothetical protein
MKALTLTTAKTNNCNMKNTPNKFRFLKWVSVIGVSLTSVGLGGMLLAIRAFPDGNLLGGWGLILGPIYWLGLLVSFISVLAWIVVGLRWLWRRAMKHDANPQ